MGTLKKLTEEYFGNIERSEDILEKLETLPDGVETHKFRDNNGRIHNIGYYIPSAETNVLKCLIDRLIELRGNGANLNDIDVSNFMDFENLFNDYAFNGDISGWITTNVENMEGMFAYSYFRGDISKWDVQNVQYMHAMFSHSEFDGNISDWNVKSVLNMEDMFYYSKFSGKKGSLESWGERLNDPYMKDMFLNCPYEKNKPSWYTDDE